VGLREGFLPPHQITQCVYLTKSEPILNGTDGALRAPNQTLGRGGKERGLGEKEFPPRPRFPPPPNFVPVKLARRPKLAVSKIYKNMHILITSLADIIVFVNLFA